MIKPSLFCALAAFPWGLVAQTPATLPEAPTPQLLAYDSNSPAPYSSSVQIAELEQNSAPATPQQPTTAPQATGTATTAQQPVEDEDARRKREVADQEKQRMLGLMPEFNVVNNGDAAPIRAKEKFSLFFHSAFDPFQFAIAGIDAGIEQAENTYPEWHQGFTGLAKRYGAAYADSFDGNLWGNAILPSVLHQDPRYFRIGEGTFKHRLVYSMLSTVRCKGDNGKWQPNISNIAGNIIGGGISNLYYPASDRGVGLTFERGLTVTAEGAFGAFAEEFYPDFLRWRQHRHDRKVAAAAAAANAKS